MDVQKDPCDNHVGLNCEGNDSTMTRVFVESTVDEWMSSVEEWLLQTYALSADLQQLNSQERNSDRERRKEGLMIVTYICNAVIPNQEALGRIYSTS
jgi:hypothetical protein